MFVVVACHLKGNCYRNPYYFLVMCIALWKPLSRHSIPMSHIFERTCFLRQQLCCTAWLKGNVYRLSIISMDHKYLFYHSSYPFVDFSNSAQKLAVGTLEGACVIYDLRTATRSVVLEVRECAQWV